MSKSICFHILISLPDFSFVLFFLFCGPGTWHNPWMTLLASHGSNFPPGFTLLVLIHLETAPPTTPPNICFYFLANIMFQPWLPVSQYQLSFRCITEPFPIIPVFPLATCNQPSYYICSLIRISSVGLLLCVILCQFSNCAFYLLNEEVLASLKVQSPNFLYWFKCLTISRNSASTIKTYLLIPESIMIELEK